MPDYHILPVYEPNSTEFKFELFSEKDCKSVDVERLEKEIKSSLTLVLKNSRSKIIQ